MRAHLIAAAVPLIAGCFSSPFSTRGPASLPPEVKVGLVEHVYLVHGRTVATIHESLLRGAPHVAKGHAWALTTWRVGWGGRSTMHGGTCRLASLSVRVQVEIVLPRWDDRAGTNRGTSAAWDDFEAALRVHEEGHRVVATRAGLALLETLGSVRSPTCDLMAEGAGTVARRVLAKYRDADRAYDRRAGTGSSQGVVWPP